MPDLLPRAQGVVRFDMNRWDDLHGRVVRRIAARIDLPSPGRGEIVVMGDTLGLHLTVNPDTDELIVTLCEGAAPGGDDWVEVEELADCIGREIGWSWSAINSQGYWDLFALAFDGIVPNVAFLGMASTIDVLRMAPLSEPRSPVRPE
ncbi:DUF6334 family protein [Caulobacter sp. 17J80-11]|uniref:DUF6334 family protein n=1 Tax=Caulobacter sp. 17J80-11 TaxID=2763502 RepID=UPI0016537CBD|nr:DUF6334 family protein [Caulobacter sp. 17J80-11]MBC6981362.1 hypothetical protein [Caulobacter sp. 17J80-11]